MGCLLMSRLSTFGEQRCGIHWNAVTSHIMVALVVNPPPPPPPPPTPHNLVPSDCHQQLLCMAAVLAHL